MIVFIFVGSILFHLVNSQHQNMNQGEGGGQQPEEECIVNCVEEEDVRIYINDFDPELCGANPGGIQQQHRYKGALAETHVRSINTILYEQYCLYLFL